MSLAYPLYPQVTDRPPPSALSRRVTYGAPELVHQCGELRAELGADADERQLARLLTHLSLAVTAVGAAASAGGGEHLLDERVATLRDEHLE